MVWLELSLLLLCGAVALGLPCREIALWGNQVPATFPLCHSQPPPPPPTPTPHAEREYHGSGGNMHQQRTCVSLCRISQIEPKQPRSYKLLTGVITFLVSP